MGRSRARMAKVKSMEPSKSTRLSLLFWLTGLSTVAESSEVAEGELGRETITRIMASMMGGTWPKKDLENPISVSQGFRAVNSPSPADDIDEPSSKWSSDAAAQSGN
jgi:hypothetical protein